MVVKGCTFGSPASSCLDQGNRATRGMFLPLERGDEPGFAGAQAGECGRIKRRELCCMGFRRQLGEGNITPGWKSLLRALAGLSWR